MSEQNTAYDQSLKAGQELLQSKQTEHIELDRYIQNINEGKAAFRTAYAFFEEIIPITGGENYWITMTKKANERCNAVENSDIAMKLIMAVFDWATEQCNKQQLHYQA